MHNETVWWHKNNAFEDKSLLKQMCKIYARFKLLSHMVLLILKPWEIWWESADSLILQKFNLFFIKMSFTLIFSNHLTNFSIKNTSQVRYLKEG